MAINILSVGQKPPPWCDTAINDYLKRLQQFSKITLSVLPISTHHKQNQHDIAKKEEAKSILAHCSSDAFLVTLDERGKSYTSPALATQLNKWLVNHHKLTFLIGGPAGLHQDCYTRANTLWSLSSLTLPHQFAKIVLLEQLYRAFSILNNHPYHRA